MFKEDIRVFSWGTYAKSKGGPLTREGKVGRQCAKVKLLLPLLPSLPFQEQFGNLSRFLNMKASRRVLRL